MTHLYSNPSPLYPPRAEHASNALNIGQYDNGEYLAQTKYNGDCVVIAMNENTLQVYNRHKQLYTKMKPGIITRDLYRGKGVQILVGEYLSKNQLGEYGLDFNHSFVIWDILVHNSDYLIHSTFENRLTLLEELYPSSCSKVVGGEVFLFDFIRTTGIHKVYKAATFEGGFEELFKQAIETPLYEGFVLKKKNGPLTFGYKEKNNAGWQLKFRKPTKNYHF